MTPKYHDGIYVVLFVANALLEALTQTNVLPGPWAHYATLASLVVAAALPKFRGSPSDG